MSGSRTNGLTKDYSGKFGDQYVLRRKNRKSLMTKLPENVPGNQRKARKRLQTGFLKERSSPNGSFGNGGLF